jgi:hypothetical protein
VEEVEELVVVVVVVVVELVVEVEVEQQVQELAKWTERSDPKLVLLIEKHVITSHASTHDLNAWCSKHCT